MSFSYSMIAARLSPSELQQVILDAWPELEILEGPVDVGDRDAAFQWARPRSAYLDGRSPEDVKLFYKEGEWTVLADLSMMMASDTAKLQDLSEKAGRVIVATTQGTAGYAGLMVFDDGAQTRSIEGVDGEVTAAGDPLPEEDGLDLWKFYLDELDAIWVRMRLKSFLGGVPGESFVALQVKDKTDYGREMETAVREGQTEAHAPRAKKPWWRLW